LFFFSFELEQQNKEFDLSDSQAVNEVNQAKTRCQVVKRIIKTYLNDAPPNDGNTKTPIEKPPSNSILSSNLITRVGFSSNMNQSAMKPVVTFNEESLSNGKVLVSSTTNDEKVGSNLKSRSLKRKLNDDEIGDHKPLEYQGTLKDPIPNVSKTIIKLNKSSLNDHSVLISTNQNAVKTAAMDFSRQNSPNLRITKTIQINKKEAPSEVVPTRTAELSNLKVSVFKQIKNVNKTEILGKLAGTHEKSKIISLKKIKTSTTSAATISRLNSNQSANNYLKTSDIKSRLNFN
jgi:hypothetical protein